MPREPLESRSELPWLIAGVVALLAGWYGYNRYVIDIYPKDASEHGRFHLITYGSDPNPARADQINKFNQYYRREGLKVVLVPGGSESNSITTTSAAKTAPDIIDAFAPEDVRTFIKKGIAQPLNRYLKDGHVDIESITWPSRLDEMRVPNPRWKEGDPPLDRNTYYCVPNNMDVQVVFFNHTLYDRVKEERERAGLKMPPEPWLNWTWWDYAMIAKALQRRSDTGRFLSFGGAQPEIEVLYRQIGESMRGESRAGFDRLGPAERRALGVGDLSWDDCVAFYRQRADGGYDPFPNRAALEQTLQYLYDLINVIRGAPSATDANQMANMGGFAAAGAYGQFKAGLLGMHMCGRWFLGQARAECGFDWRLYRMPRWVPLEEWERWQREGKQGPDRDGPWGEREHPGRGFALPLGGRLAFISSSSKAPAKAFKFLEYLVTNQDFNKILLVEDGMGADVKAARDYLSKPDPLFPNEVLNRPVEHELGTLANLYARPQWPYTNRGLGRDQPYLDMNTHFSRDELLDEALAASTERTEYRAATAYFPELRPSTPEVGRRLAAVLLPKLEDGLARGAAIEAPTAVAAPSWATLLVLGSFAAAFGGAGINAWRKRKAASHG